MTDQDKEAVPEVVGTSMWSSIKLVAWSFLGIRSKSGYQQDLAKVNPMHVVLVGVVGVLLLVVGLIILVHWVVAK